MASLSSSSSFSARVVLGFQRATTSALIPAISISKSRASSPSARFSLRNVKFGRSEARGTMPKIFANLTEGGNTVNGESSGAESGGADQGPPFLTILAGFLVFFFICWVLGSILMWIFSIIVTVPPAK